MESVARPEGAGKAAGPSNSHARHARKSSPFIQLTSHQVAIPEPDRGTPPDGEHIRDTEKLVIQGILALGCWDREPRELSDLEIANAAGFSGKDTAKRRRVQIALHGRIIDGVKHPGLADPSRGWITITPRQDGRPRLISVSAKYHDWAPVRLHAEASPPPAADVVEPPGPAAEHQPPPLQVVGSPAPAEPAPGDAPPAHAVELTAAAVAELREAASGTGIMAELAKAELKKHGLAAAAPGEAETTIPPERRERLRELAGSSHPMSGAARRTLENPASAADPIETKPPAAAEATRPPLEPGASAARQREAEQLTERLRRRGIHLRLDSGSGEVRWSLAPGYADPDPPSDDEKAALQRLKPEIVALLKGPPASAPGAPDRPQRTPRVRAAPQIRNLISQLEAAPQSDDKDCKRFADLIMSDPGFSCNDEDPKRSRETFLGWARDLKTGKLPKAILIEAFDEACRPKAGKRGAVFVAAVKRKLHARHTQSSEP